MSDEIEPLQFDRAEFSESSSGLDCAVCNNAIGGHYYTVNGEPTCESCRGQFGGDDTVDSGPVGRFLKASIFGFIAAVIGAAVYYGILWATGYEIGLIAIAVGWLVGLAVYTGSDNRGGLVYQLLAVVFTYISICGGYVPMVYQSLLEEGEGGMVASGAGAILWIVALVIAMAVPFLQGFENIIGILIIGFGLYQAWKGASAKEIVIEGPFSISTTTPPPFTVSQG